MQGRSRVRLRRRGWHDAVDRLGSCTPDGDKQEEGVERGWLHDLVDGNLKDVLTVSRNGSTTLT